MWKAALAGTAALAIAGSTLVYAQQRDMQQQRDPHEQMMREHMMREHMGGGRGQPNLEDMRAFSEARIAALKAGLTLTPDQEKNWPAFEQAAREVAKLRIDRLSAAIEARGGGQPRPTDPADRLHRRAERMQQTGAALQKLADATDPLYKSLDDGQKRRFALLARFARPDEGRRMGMRGMMDRMHGHQFGGPGGRDPHGWQDWHRQGFEPRSYEDRGFEHQGLRQDGSERSPSRSELDARPPMQGEERL